MKKAKIDIVHIAHWTGIIAANGSPLLRYFFGVESCVAQVLSRGDEPRHSLQTST